MLRGPLVTIAAPPRRVIAVVRVGTDEGQEARRPLLTLLHDAGAFQVPGKVRAAEEVWPGCAQSASWSVWVVRWLLQSVFGWHSE